jgi:hypothetical protein
VREAAISKTTDGKYCLRWGTCDYGGDPARAASREESRLVPLVGGVGALAGKVAGLATVVAPAAAITATTTSAITALLTVPGHVPFLAALVAATAAAVATPSTIPTAATTSAVAAATRTGTTGECAAAGCSYVYGLGAAVVAGSNDELDGVALVEAAEAVGLDGGLVHEEVLAAAFGGDEAKPLGAIEPLDGASHPLRRHRGRRSKENPRSERRGLGSAVDGEDGVAFCKEFGVGPQARGRGKAERFCLRDPPTHWKVGPEEHRSHLTVTQGKNHNVVSAPSAALSATAKVHRSPPTPHLQH